MIVDAAAAITALHHVKLWVGRSSVDMCAQCWVCVTLQLRLKSNHFAIDLHTFVTLISSGIQLLSFFKKLDESI